MNKLLPVITIVLILGVAILGYMTITQKEKIAELKILVDRNLKMAQEQETTAIQAAAEARRAQAIAAEQMAIAEKTLENCLNDK